MAHPTFLRVWHHAPTSHLCQNVQIQVLGSCEPHTLAHRHEHAAPWMVARAGAGSFLPLLVVVRKGRFLLHAPIAGRPAARPGTPCDSALFRRLLLTLWLCVHPLMSHGLRPMLPSSGRHPVQFCEINFSQHCWPLLPGPARSVPDLSSC